jgi:putative ABC transport system permease protein
VSETEFVRFDVNWVDTTFINTLGLRLASGRFFAADRPRDLAQGIVVNEAAVRRIGWTEPLGKHLGTGDSRKEIIGVLHDFHSASMYETIQPLVLEYGEVTRFAAVRASTSDLRRLVTDLGSIWGTFIPDRPFEYSFLDADFKAMYRKETQMGRLFTAFSVLTIIVALLGLFGLASFDAQQRTKEIGIRKSLGASVSNITVLLSRQFFMLVLVSFVISIPIIYWIMSRWLERFAYRIDLTVGLFALSCLLVLFVTTVTIAVQTVRAAVTSPVECLRQE